MGPEKGAHVMGRALGGRFGIRALFGASVAVCAAAMADPLVEGASNAGWFGPGNFTDHSSLDVIPGLIAAAVLSVLYVVLAARLQLGGSSGIRDAMLDCSPRPVMRRLPMFFAAQLGVLFVLETLEQIVTAGHPLGGAIWLGAPVVIALAAHALACAFVAYALSRALEALARTVVRIVALVSALLLSIASKAGAIGRVFRSLAPRGRTNLLAHRAGKRAPPFLFA